MHASYPRATPDFQINMCVKVCGAPEISSKGKGKSLPYFWHSAQLRCHSCQLDTLGRTLPSRKYLGTHFCL